MPRVLITAEVDDLEKWEKGFRTHGDLFKQMGVSSMEFGTRKAIELPCAARLRIWMLT